MKDMKKFINNLGDKEAVGFIVNLPPGALCTYDEKRSTFQFIMPQDTYEHDFKFRCGILNVPPIIRAQDFFPFKKMVTGDINDFASTEAMIVNLPLDDEKWSLYVEDE